MSRTGNPLVLEGLCGGSTMFAPAQAVIHAVFEFCTLTLFRCAEAWQPRILNKGFLGAESCTTAFLAATYILHSFAYTLSHSLPWDDDEILSNTVYFEMQLHSREEI